MSSRKIFLVSILRNPNPAFDLSPDVAASLFRILAARSPSFPALRASHALLIVSGAVPFHKQVNRRLAALYSRLSPDDAVLLHCQLRSPDPIISGFVIKSLVRRRRDPSDVVAFFCRHVHPVGCRPSRCTFPLLITSSKFSESIHQGEILHCLALKLGFLGHLPVPNSLIHMYASCDGLDLARQLFDEMPKKDRVSYNSLLDGYVKSCDFDEAERLLRIIPDWNVISWSTLFNGFVRNQMFSRGIRFFQQMQKLGVEPDDCSVVSLLVVYANYELAQHGKSVHGLLLRRWRQIPLHVSNALVNFYCKCGLLDAAAKVFERTMEKDLISWNTLISGFGSNGRGEEALGFFKRMLQEGTKPNDITFIGILVACAHSGLVEEALHHFKMMSSEFGMKPTFAHHWCLVDLYVRLESPCDALKVIQEMPLYNQSAIWGAVICLAKVRGDISVGERLGKHLIELEPDNSRRYLPLLNIYTAASRWDKYKELMELMKARGLKKLPDCTLIDLNLVVHKFLVGDKSQPEIEKVYGVLENIANQLKLQPPKADDAMVDAI
ncbi:pentatricopeptide repeat-containing protein At1g05750, chloroplastic-like [Musa acuminata AAA Group]|uniref:pentatricopeptide repeat-containing protein At1g05750, chloroplastic-like n=1 Tax=Musa acuminata AAA Group TaxID=214697 RepID=UPI0031D3993F